MSKSANISANGEEYLNDSDYAELDRRVKSYESGESKTHSWSSVKKRILAGKKKKRK